MQPSIDLGVLRVPSAGQKKAAPIVLTIDQRTAVDSALEGYLVDYESLYLEGEIKDYPLFPAGRFKNKKAKVLAEPKALTRDAALGMFHDLERIAGVSSIPGRGCMEFAAQLLMKRKTSRRMSVCSIPSLAIGIRPLEGSSTKTSNGQRSSNVRRQRETAFGKKRSRHHDRMAPTALFNSKRPPECYPLCTPIRKPPPAALGGGCHNLINSRQLHQERATGLEPATSSLGSWHSTN